MWLECKCVGKMIGRKSRQDFEHAFNYVNNISNDNDKKVCHL